MIYIKKKKLSIKIIIVPLIIVAVIAVILWRFNYGIRLYFIVRSNPEHSELNGAEYIYDKSLTDTKYLLWGIKKSDLKFWVSNVPSDILKETDSTISYLMNPGSVYDQDTLTFYFNSSDQFYKVIEDYDSQFLGEDTSLSGALRDFTNYEFYIKTYLLDDYYFQYDEKKYTYNTTWRLDDLNSEEKSSSAMLESPDANLMEPLLSVNDELLLLDRIVDLNIDSTIDFEGMTLEHYLMPNPDDPSQYIRKAVYTSRFISED